MKKKIRGLIKKYYYKLLIFYSYFCDAASYCKNFALSSNDKNKIEYRILLIVHSIEKGMCNENPRRFGKSKVDDLVELLNIQKNNKYEESFGYKYGIYILNKYIEFYNEHLWDGTEEYIKVRDFLSDKEINAENHGGYKVIYKKDFMEYSKVDYDAFLSSRHSVRKFSDQKISLKEVEDALSMAVKTPSACNRQMVKVYYYQNKDDIDYITSIAQGITGFDISNINYILITYDENAFLIPGERNQGYFNAGLFAMNLVNAFHSMEIGTCFIQFARTHTEEKYVKERLEIPNNESITCIVVFGHYADENIVPYSLRKEINDILKVR